MTTFEQLDALSSQELHRRAVHAAERRLDIRFFWHLFEMIPEAEAVSGNVREGQEDVARASGWLYDFVNRGGKLDDALRPFYIDYLQRHDPAREPADRKPEDG